MKKLAILISLFLNSVLFCQETNNVKPFTNINLGILGGGNFNSIPTLGGSLILEGKSNISSQSILKISIGFSSLFENNSYQIKSYSHFIIDNIEGYQLTTYDIDKIQYSIIPINLGFEYVFSNNQISPFGIIELGYNFYSGEEQVAMSTSGQYFNTLEEVPNNYRNPAPKTFDDNSYSLGLGMGIKYKLTLNMDLNIRYMFRYNDKILNSNQILFGISF